MKITCTSTSHHTCLATHVVAQRRSAFTATRPCSVFSRTISRCRAEPENQPEPSTPSVEPPVAKQPTKEEEPVWVRRERERELIKKEGGELPFAVYLIGSAIVAIAAVGSIFEYTSSKPIFDVIASDSPLYTPILGLFALTGLPTSGFLFYKAVSTANKEAERMDKLDGY